MTYGGISEEDFNINPVTGVITTIKSLDRELQEYYTVTGKVLKHHTPKHSEAFQNSTMSVTYFSSQFMQKMEDSPLTTPKPQ